MKLLRLIWKDILWLNSRTPAVKMAGLIIVILLIWGAWYLGTEWWNVKSSSPKSNRPAARWEVPLVIFGLALLCYVIYVIERYRKL